MDGEGNDKAALPSVGYNDVTLLCSGLEFERTVEQKPLCERMLELNPIAADDGEFGVTMRNCTDFPSD